jgi:hypothetical protein
MAISRFRKTFAKLDPTLYVPEKRNLVPDITPLTNIATGMQSLFDDVSVIQPPVHLNNDANDVQSKYLNPIKEAKDKALETFTSNNSLEGVKALRDIKKFMIEANQPGGVAYNFKANAEASSKWNEDLKSRLAKGDITRDVYNSYVTDASKFKSYNDDGEYSTFQGGQPASYVDLKKMFDDSAGKYKADKNYTLQSNGIYTHKITNEIVDLKTVYSGIMQSVMADTKAFSYIQDLQRVYGTEKAMKMVNDMAYSSADAAAHVNRDISMFSTDQLALHVAKKAIDKAAEKQERLANGIDVPVTVKEGIEGKIKLSSGATIEDEMKMEGSKVANGFYKDDKGNIYQRQANGRYRSLTDDSVYDPSKEAEKTKESNALSSPIGSKFDQVSKPRVPFTSTENTSAKNLQPINIANLDATKDKKIIDFIEKEMPGLRETAINLQKEKGKDISVNELNARAVQQYRTSQNAMITEAVTMVTFDEKGELNGRTPSEAAAYLSTIVDKTTVYRRDKNGNTKPVNDNVVADLAEELDNLQYKKDNKEESKYKIIGKFDEDSIFYPNNYIVKDKQGNEYLINTATPEQMDRSLRSRPFIQAMETPGKAIPFRTVPPLVGVSAQNLSNGKQLTGMTIIPTDSYRGGFVDDNTMVGDVSIISQPKFDANNNMLNYGQGSDLVVKFTERIINPQTGEFTKGNDYMLALGNSSYTSLKEILKNQ